MNSIKTDVFVDLAGSGFGSKSAEQECIEHIETFEEFLRPATLNWKQIFNPAEIRTGTKLLLFDYGGMGYGTEDLVTSNCRAVIKWAQDNPSALVMVVSNYTWDHYFKYVAQEMDVDLAALPNVSLLTFKKNDPIPEWFRLQEDLPFLEEEPKTAIKAPSPFAGLTPVGGILSNVQFFIPTDEFLEFMADEYGPETRIYDVGCGVGHVTAALREQGLTVIAIDVNQREFPSIDDIVIADALSYPFEPGSVVMLARPCHGVFVDEVIQHSLNCECTVLYVGKQSNVEDDLGDRFKGTSVFFGAGEDDEVVIQIKPAVEPAPEPEPQTPVRRQRSPEEQSKRDAYQAVINRPVAFVTIPVRLECEPGQGFHLARFKFSDCLVDVGEPDNPDKRIATIGGEMGGVYGASFPDGKGDLHSYGLTPSSFWEVLRRVHEHVKTVGSDQARLNPPTFATQVVAEHGE